MFPSQLPRAVHSLSPPKPCTDSYCLPPQLLYVYTSRVQAYEPLTPLNPPPTHHPSLVIHSPPHFSLPDLLFPSFLGRCIMI